MAHLLWSKTHQNGWDLSLFPVASLNNFAFLYNIATLPGMWDRTITIGSAGKTFSATGWKVNTHTHTHAVLMFCQSCCADGMGDRPRAPSEALTDCTRQHWLLLPHTTAGAYICTHQAHTLASLVVLSVFNGGYRKQWQELWR